MKNGEYGGDSGEEITLATWTNIKLLQWNIDFEWLKIGPVVCRETLFNQRHTLQASPDTNKESVPMKTLGSRSGLNQRSTYLRIHFINRCKNKSR